jgi:catechol 2,3-dioxygenase-like lactoylglutathione lyase family enzyme
MEQRMNYITLGVSDLKTSRNFYENVFGWKPLPASDENIVFFQLNQIILGLFPDHSLAEDAGVDATGTGFKKFSLAHNVRSEKEVDELFADLESKGATVIKRPAKVFWGGYSSYIADPDGNLWEIAFNPFLEIA